ncbi:MAG: FAD-dependent thymidylate synthase [Spirochaetia bacterium]|nr:FAD-dependent thymidylate synthase [Spirochaetia bacterium]
MSFVLQSYLEKYNALLENFNHLKVELIDHAASPFNLGIASARTCYSSKGILLPEDMEKNMELRDKIAVSTMNAGHLTTRQHAHFVFGISGVSRNVIWQFLHAHPYYNSEQVSQRYVSIRGDDWFTLPESLKTTEIVDFHKNAITSYNNLIKALKPYIEEEYFSVFRARKNSKEKYETQIHKRCMEIARYVMPLSTTAYMYHTINALTLYRYVRMMHYFKHDEIIVLVLKMLQAVNRVDPLLVNEIPQPEDFSANLEENDPLSALKLNSGFDEKLKKSGVISRLVSATENPEKIIKEIAESALGYCDENILDKIFNAEMNSSLSDTLYPVTLDVQARILNHLQFTFQKKLSHTADSQEQRHRTLAGARPKLYNQISLHDDFITPFFINEVSAAKDIYNRFMEENFVLLNKLYKNGETLERLSYLLPNAFPVRFYESGDYLNFFHKWKARLCYTSQEEIFYSSLDEVKQLADRFSFFKKYIGAPCYLRKTIKPVCPEGDKYCGVKVWKLSLDEYQRKI